MTLRRTLVAFVLAALAASACTTSSAPPSTAPTTTSSTTTTAPITTTTSTTTTLPPTTTTTIQPGPIRPGLDWIEVDIPEATIGGGFFVDLAVGGPGFVVVGSDTFGRPRVWFSPDLDLWAEVDLSALGVSRSWDIRSFSPAIGVNPVPQIVATANGDTAVVVFGHQVEEDESGTPRFGVLRYSDRSWARFGPSDEGLNGSPPGIRSFRAHQIRRVATYDDGYVAVGAGQWFRPFDTDDVAAAVWYSDDGSAWTVESADEEPLGGETNRSMLDIVDGPTGLVAVGARIGPGEDLDGMAWRFSSDSDGPVMWRTAQDGGVVGDAAPVVVPVDPDATTTTSDTTTTSTTTTTTVGDGEPVDEPPSEPELPPAQLDPPGTGEVLRAVAASAERYVAVGFDGEVGLLSEAAAIGWTSVDGDEWVPIPEITGLGRLLTVAYRETGFVAAGILEGAPVVMRSFDGLGWEIEREAPAFVQIVAFDGGYLGITFDRVFVSPVG